MMEHHKNLDFTEHHYHQHSTAPKPGLPFAGRVGGNQDFVVTPRSSEESKSTLAKRTPDAAPLRTLRDALNLDGFLEPIIWKSAAIECWATGCLVFTVGLIGSALGAYAPTRPLSVPLIGSLTNWIAITMFVYASAPASGGHLNPLITMGTLAAGLCTVPRALLYVLAQCIGALGGAFFLKLGLGGADYYPSGVVTGCTYDLSVLSYGRAYVLETGTTLTVIFLSFGVGLDPRQGKILGAALSPVLVGLTVGLASFGTAFVTPGWHGATLNPARCLGLMSANENLRAHWVHWLAAITGAVVNGTLYHLIPPYHTESV